MLLSETLSIQQNNSIVYFQRLYSERNKLLDLEKNYNQIKFQLSELIASNSKDVNRIRILKDNLKRIRNQINQQKRVIYILKSNRY